MTDSQDGTERPPFIFHNQFQGWMDVYAPVQRYETYLNNHQEWFHRCAHPMKAEPVGKHGYILTLGRYGSHGYEVEPKIGLHLLPQEQGVYRIETIPVPEQPFLNYEVNFQAAMALVPMQANPETDSDLLALNVIDYTRVNWELDLRVEMYFPRFIYRLPHGLIQGTGNRVLAQIVRQVSYRLTAKVQDDFHKTIGLDLGKRWRRKRFHAERVRTLTPAPMFDTPDEPEPPAA
ncbi:DUF1997 domain-containing protein [Thermosynechococcus sp. HN-54]|uniref:DUF1997 domain-containing protein n=1 Tax=Thermosynechococcus sp. HN-54 TaxID=2933959 RepID=UPI00202CEDCF|nr:DUF1997 domain-containing protein [Thermosynechococcus sp. HN-54]URR36712.1 DUF1997 domain-containing protein [Thermosynechococcus sp. HN-54]